MLEANIQYRAHTKVCRLCCVGQSCLTGMSLYLRAKCEEEILQAHARAEARRVQGYVPPQPAGWEISAETV